ncbi:multicopper oxidase domain-containing protein [Aurantimonas marina]|uniref:multicopper oxidase domain-containing protein n=1 Tax=Aurantimonas marina TaxID=2780508 RepID=UPI0019D29DD1|nr:multicopper oxidase domain-containing protein [Aurantimonas marina]
MILRLFTLVGVVAIAGALYLVLPQGIGPAAFQAVPDQSALAGYVEAGLFPDPDSLSENDDVGHGVFEEPAEDEARIAAAREAMGAMPGMSGMQMDGAAPMDMAGDGAALVNEEQTTQPTNDDMAAMPGMNDEAADSGSTSTDAPMEMATEQTAQPADDGVADMPGMSGEVPDNAGGDGLVVLAADASVDREIEMTMREWGYSIGELDVQPGERIRLKIRNAGEIPHEFMFMPMANMQAIGYRLERADWNLLEHEAPYERSLILPGQSFEVTMRIAKPGAWMFMCMFPYHMQFGMMGQMATPGLSMAM